MIYDCYFLFCVSIKFNIALHVKLPVLVVNPVNLLIPNHSKIPPNKKNTQKNYHKTKNMPLSVTFSMVPVSTKSIKKKQNKKRAVCRYSSSGCTTFSARRPTRSARRPSSSSSNGSGSAGAPKSSAVCPATPTAPVSATSPSGRRASSRRRR